MSANNKDQMSPDASPGQISKKAGVRRVKQYADVYHRRPDGDFFTSHGIGGV